MLSFIGFTTKQAAEPPASTLENFVHARILSLTQLLAQLSDEPPQINSNDALATERKDLLEELYRSKLSFYKLLAGSKQSEISKELDQTFHDYEVTVNNLYKSETTSSYYLLTKLNKELENQNDSKRRRKIKKAIEICQIKIALFGLDVKILQEKITRLLQIDWLPKSIVFESELQKNKYIEYDKVNLSYVDGLFHIAFDSEDVFKKINSGNRLLDIENFLNCIFVLEEDDQGSNQIIDLLAHITSKRVRWEEESQVTAKSEFKMF